jgi:hypothetical protein
MRKLLIAVLLAALCGLWLARQHRSSGRREFAPVPVAMPSAFTPAVEIPPAPSVVAGRPVSAVVAFRQWTSDFLVAPESARPALVPSGMELARERRVELERLIRTDPRRAFEHSVSDGVRGRLPQEIRGLLEERVSGRGFFGVLIADDPQTHTRDVTREVVVNGRRFDAFVYGRRSSEVTRERDTLWGIAVGKSLAVHEEPVRVLSATEAALVEVKGNCPVSGQDAAGSPAAVVGEVAGKYERFCAAGHLASLSQRLAADGGYGNEGQEPPVAHDGWTQGPRSVLFMRVTYPDDMTEAITESAAVSLMDTASAWFADVSYNTTWLVTDVTPLMVLPQPKSWYCENGDGYILGDAREVARSYGYDTDNYQLDIVRFPSPGSGCNGYSYGGKAYVRGKGCWMLSNSSGTQIHELGHNYGVWHANFWTGLGDGIISHGSHVEYGNPFDVMGSSGGSGHLNAQFQNSLDFLQDIYVRTVTTNGTYRLFTYDIPALSPDRAYALKVRKDYDRNYWVEFRRKVANNWFLNGVILNWDPWNNGATNSGSGTHLLDTTPGTPAGNSSKDDCPVTIGRTYSDLPSGVHITPVARGSNSPENWIDVVVNLGAFPGNRPPSATLIADRTNVATGLPVNFSIIASDPDGDALAYGWDFGDLGFGPNSPNASRAWATAGEYVVRCTVSDMKGGVFMRQVPVTVGSPGTFRASGRVTLDGQPAEGVRVHNGQSGTSYRGGYTDSDGCFTVAGLSNGAVNLGAVKYGHTLSASGWANPVSISANVTNLDFIATPMPAVGFTVLGTNMAEAGLVSSLVRITRGGDTNSSLAVRMVRSGSATLNTDYTMTPAPTGFPLVVWFAAGVTNVDLTLTPLADNTSEGPEFMMLTMIENAAYVLAPSAEVAVFLNDDDPDANSTINVLANNSNGSAGDNIATESGNDTGVFTFSRSGSLAREILVQYVVSGTASMGVDYTPLAGVVAIPAGQGSVMVTLNAIDDAEVEGNETVSVTILTNAAYNVGISNATVTILDDDLSVVTVVATDTVASENSGNNGTFVFERVGSVVANLLVNYTVSGTASNGTDYIALGGSVTIAAGRPNVTLSLSAINDALVEGDETVTVTITSSTAYNVGNPGLATVVLQDNELPTVAFTVSDSTAQEPGPDAGEFRFTRTGAATNDLTVFYRITGTATPGADYVALPGSFLFAAGSTSAVVTVAPLDDLFVEVNESVTMMLLPDPNYVVGTPPSPSSVTLRDDDDLTAGAPAIGFTLAASKGPENDTLATISLTLSTNRPAGNCSVNYSVTGGTATGGGVDYTLATGVLVFPTNEVNRTLSFTVINDTNVEPDETIVITLSNPTNAVLDATAAHTFTILDDDGAGTLTITSIAGAAEAGAVPGAFRLARSGPVTNDQTVFLQIAGSASAPSDYAPLTETVVIPAGTNAIELPVVPVDDATDETNETVSITLLPSPGAKIGSPKTATVTILDNDTNNLPIVSVSAVDAAASEPGADRGTFRIARDRDTNGALLVSFTIGGSAAGGTDYTNLGTSLTLPAGVWFTNLIVHPRDDAAFETNETVVLTLTTLAAYRVDPLQPAAIVTIADDEQGVAVSGRGVSAEDGSSAGSFVFTRTGGTATNLTVRFRWAGTASTNDFTPAATNIVIPAGTNSVILPILAMPDALLEGTETLVLTLATNAAYAVLTNHTAAILIADAFRPWDAWRATNFTPAELLLPLVSGPDGDIDGDGWKNLLEYAFNRDPKTPDTDRGLSGRVEPLPSGGDGYVIRFPRRKPPTDVQYTVEVTADFASWESGVAEEILPALDDGNGITETARYHVAPAVSGGRFVRVRVVLSP